ncbi:TPA: hypothetical protein U2M28_001769 [Providencia stuartii]|uniref:Lipoprotein n=1 Tax=Providencia stuartii ATCC 25827 TaxID=471874 RepID=A0AA87CRQ7_PROST|nr:MULTISPECIES: hypothetical protein [Providencia]APG50812.1 hypothetical protein BGK56_07590 [Providencia stuartii]AVL39453.1 hypothetical protein CEP70_05320 [Providencia stuartii]EDU60329.1 hypothetical protein PROSTU_03535 [Providencia stuartii ATCC 25827]KNZ85304.1 hypothetical protein AFL46_09210 [Providencia stuartii]MBG5904260.1 hypothetical protein [Providencia stuartii]
MKKHIFSITVLSAATLLVTGCSSNNDMWGEFANILSDANPVVQESEEWEAYSIKTTQQGVTYASASSADQQFVSKKMDAEYADALYRVSSPFARSDKTKEQLAKDNQGYRFKYNEIMVVKDKKTANTIGYCVNYDSDQIENGQVKPVKEKDKIRNHFIYVDKVKPLSVMTVGSDFTKVMCGEEFYNKYKK